jgi:toxin YoeB
MRLLWTREALEDYQHWQRTDPKLVVAINALIDDIGMNDPFKGLGKPEPLKHSLKGWWSRRITREHRLDRRTTRPAFRASHKRWHCIASAARGDL